MALLADVPDVGRAVLDEGLHFAVRDAMAEADDHRGSPLGF